MSALHLRRTLLTTARFSRPVAVNLNNKVNTTSSSSLLLSQRPTTLYNKPLFPGEASKRAFSATTAANANMGKEGVHNLANKADFDQAMAEKDTLMVVDCFATWCGPCKVIAPKVVAFSDEYPNARFYKLDVDELPDVAQELAVRAMPTFFLFKNGEKVAEVVGANPVALQTAIQQNYE